MTATVRNIDEVENSLYARREALQTQHAKLNEEHGAAALAAAEGIPGATNQIPVIKQKLREIQDELAALDAADRTLERRKHAARVQQRIDTVKTAEAGVPKASEQVSAAWDRLEASFAELGSAWQNLQFAARQANRLAYICQEPGVMPGHTEVTNDLCVDLLQNMASKLLWIATGDQIQPDHYSFGNTPATPAEVRQRIDYSLNNLKLNAGLHAERSVAVIQRDA